VSERRKGRAKRPYSRPVIEQVRLIPEEAVLAACKSPGGGGGPGTGSCKQRGQPCSVQGS